MKAAPEPKGVFINCPYDEDYNPFFEATIFCVIRCGFKARAAAEHVGSTQPRISRLRKIIQECPLGIHDISRTELNPDNDLPRFNMPFELGLFLGAQSYGDRDQRKKEFIILDTDTRRYREFISDIGGQDISEHGGDPRQLVSKVRTFLNSHSGDAPLPGGSVIWEEYEVFKLRLPEICRRMRISPEDLEFRDLVYIVSDYVSEEPAPEDEDEEDEASED